MAPALGGAVTRTEEAVFAAAASLLAAAILLPLSMLGVRLGEVLATGEAGALALLVSPRLWRLLAITLLRAAAITGGALAVGVPLGLLVARSDAPARRVFFALHVLPGLLPPYLLALGWLHWFGRTGFLGSEASARLLFGEVGVVAVLALAFAPLATTLTALGAWGMEAALEEAARVVAAPGRVLLRIVLPASAPAVALAALLIFALAVSELGVPMFLRVDAYAAAVFARLGGIDSAPGEAVALVLPLAALALALLAIERQLVASRDYAVLGLGGSARRPLPLGRWRTPAGLTLGLAAALGMAPLAALALRAAQGGGFAELPRWIGGSFGTSLAAAGAAATAILVLGLPLAHALVRSRPAARFPDALAVLAFVTPAAVLGVGLIQVWNRPATSWVYGSLAIVVLAFVARYAAVGLRACASVLGQGSPRLEESAAVHGAGYLRRLVHLLVPLHARGLAAAWLLVLAFCLRDLESAILVHPAGREPLTVRIFTLEANGPEAVVAALACAHAGLIAVVLLGVGLLARSGARP
jgi:iron(III) transport system permease protein